MQNYSDKITFFATDTNSIVKAEEAIIPICQWVESRDLKFVGTGFFIAQNMFITAKHVLLNETNTKPIDNPVTFSFLDGHFYNRTIFKVVAHDTADIAIGLVKPIVKSDTKEAIRNRQLVLDLSDCHTGHPVATYAYPLTTISNEENLTIANFESKFASGLITEIYPDGRDKYILPGPCYQTTMEILGGASGGPVFNSAGKVIGVNSTGFDGEPLSFITRIHEALTFKLDDIKIGDQYIEKINLFELAQRGIVSLHNAEKIKFVIKDSK